MRSSRGIYRTTMHVIDLHYTTRLEGKEDTGFTRRCYVSAVDAMAQRASRCRYFWHTVKRVQITHPVSYYLSSSQLSLTELDQVRCCPVQLCSDEMRWDEMNDLNAPQSWLRSTSSHSQLLTANYKMTDLTPKIMLMKIPSCHPQPGLQIHVTWWKICIFWSVRSLSYLGNIIKNILTKGEVTHNIFIFHVPSLTQAIAICTYC